MLQSLPHDHIFAVFHCPPLCERLSMELQHFNGTDQTASMLSSIQKCQVLKFGIEWPKEVISPASVSYYTCSMLVVPSSDSTVDWL